MSKLPVMLISGFLGSGKTTLLQYLLTQPHGKKIALIVNDMASVNIDTQVVQAYESKEHIVEMTNGCICCTLREDLFEQIEEIAESKKYDYLIIESTGIAEPLPVAQTLTFENEDGISLSEIASLDAMITMVDAAHFLELFDKEETLQEIGMGADEHDERSLSGLIAEQVEFANIIIVNKTDQINNHQLLLLTQFIQAINPQAKIYSTTYGKIDLDLVFNTHLYKKEDFDQLEIWKETIQKQEKSEADTYGITSFVYQVRTPFHPERFWNFIHESWDGVLRVKGYFWLATRPEMAGFLVQAGKVREHQFSGFWWANMDRKEWPIDDPSFQKILERHQAYPSFDKRQELVFIGMNLDENYFREKLDSCLLRKEEISQIGVINDPFPVWADILDISDDEPEYELL